MNYKKLYKRFIGSRPKRTKSRNDGLEVHHILPTSLGGEDIVENKIALTPREHFIAHLMLIKCFNGSEKAKMVYAIHRMASSVHKKKYRISKYRISSRAYAVIRNYYKSFNRERTKS